MDEKAKAGWGDLTTKASYLNTNQQLDTTILEIAIFNYFKWVSDLKISVSIMIFLLVDQLRLCKVKYLCTFMPLVMYISFACLLVCEESIFLIHSHSMAIGLINIFFFLFLSL